MAGIDWNSVSTYVASDTAAFSEVHQAAGSTLSDRGRRRDSRDEDSWCGASTSAVGGS